MSGANAPRRLLVVDDDRQMVRTLRDILTLKGWEVTEAYSGEEAVEAVRERTFDVVLMDVLMPGMSGVEALREIRGTNPRLRVVLMTAYTRDELIEQATRDGVARIMFKPVNVPDLLAFLEPGGSGRESVLVVDDDPAFLRTLSASLRQGGHEAHLAEGLDEALRLLAERVPGVVVLDLKLGDLEPRECILAIREMDPSIVLILCSGYPALLEQTSRRIPGDWVYARLEKPFSPDRLLEMLDAV